MSIQTPSSSERMMIPEQMIIGEAVALDVSAASVGVRVLAAIVDYSLYFLGFMMSFITMAATMDDDASEAITLIQSGLIMCLWWLVIPVSVEWLSRGKSAGKLITGCRVVRDDGGAIHLRHAFIRALVACIEVWALLGTVAIISCAISKRSKRLGDRLAGTYVISERSGAMAAPPLLMPSELATWAAQADMRALPGDLALAGRTFLQRASTIEFSARQRLAWDLAEQVRMYVSPEPPEGTHPERFLAAVLCERRDRELEIALRDRDFERQQLEVMTALPYGLDAAPTESATTPTRGA